MIIKKVSIVAFGGIKNKEIEFNKGINVIYGENEKGKSTIQSFIKIWLFGITSKRTKDLKNNERTRFSPISGEKISGELHLEHDNRYYIIRRSFGSSKKEDTYEVIDGLTGEGIKKLNNNEPGKYFLNVNSSTFSKTLLISQLGVLVSKDKEEEILEKSANLIGTGDENVSIQKAMEKLEMLKKSFTTPRKTGKLDYLKDKYNELLEERYQGYKLSEENIEDENNCIELKAKRDLIRKELNSLEIYKKYIKKIKLQKEYEEITLCLKRSEELKKKKRFIEESLITGDGIIDENLLNDIKEENGLLLSILDLKKESEEKLNSNIIFYEKKREKFKEVLFVEELDLDIKEKFFKITVEQQALKEKIDRWNSIYEEIKELEVNIDKRKNAIGSAIKFRPIRREVEELLKGYEEKLRELKFKMENSTELLDGKRNINLIESEFKKNRNIVTLTIIINIIVFIVGNANLLILIPFFIIYLFLGKKIFNLAIEIKSFQGINNTKKSLAFLSDEIEKIEKQLLVYRNAVNMQSYEEFMKNLKEYDEFVNFEEKERYKMEEKQLQLSVIDIKSLKKIFNDNLLEINKVLELSGTTDINKVINMMASYDIANKELLSLKIEIESIKESIERFDKELEVREERIRNKLNIIGLKDIDLFQLEEKLLEIKGKLIQREDLRKSLEVIKETYGVLTKDKDIDAIKEELRDIINENVEYSYTSEEEIDIQIRKKSNELIELEKDIKDVENYINTRFIGRRQLSTIEEDIQETMDKIQKYEIQLKAVELAILKFHEAIRDIRESFGPILNEKVLSYFKKLSSEKYKDVMVSDSYEIKVRDEGLLLPAELLSNGANDQLYLSLRLAFISMLYKNENVPIILDDAFIQYDDKRVEKVLEILNECNFYQIMIFTCQKREKEILERKSIVNNYICL